MSSERELRVRTFEELKAELENFDKIINDCLEDIDSTLTQLNTSGKWQDDHYSNFRSGFFTYYDMSINSTRQAVKESLAFLDNQQEITMKLN